MPLWRCPHCGTPQAETARCWVCHRSSTACGTCRHYRRSVAASLGYCGLDRTRQPLTGAEIRACWEGWPAEARADMPLTIVAARAPDEPPHREFIEVGASAGGAERTDGPDEPGEPDRAMAVSPSATPATDPGWSLWGDPEG